MNVNGSKQEYPKRGKTSSLVAKGRGPITGDKGSRGNHSERLSNRLLLSAQGAVPPEQRALGWYKPEEPKLDHPTSPRGKVDGQVSTVVDGGVASRGNVIHSRYKPSL